MNSSSPKKKVVVFDFDGTIVDSMDSFADIAADVMPNHYPVSRETARKMYLETSGIPFFEQLEQLFPDNKANAIAANEFEERKKLDYAAKRPFEDVKSAIEVLKNSGVKTVVSSNNFQDLVDMLAKRIDLEFDMVLGFKPGFAKGNDHFRHIEKTFGVDKDEMIFVGDSIKDAERAKNFGIDFVGRTGIFTETDFTESFPGARVVADFGALKTIIAK